MSRTKGSGCGAGPTKKQSIEEKYRRLEEGKKLVFLKDHLPFKKGDKYTIDGFATWPVDNSVDLSFKEIPHKGHMISFDLIFILK